MVKKTWKIKGDMKIIRRANGFLLHLEEDRTNVLRGGPWFLNGQILITRKWEKGIEDGTFYNRCQSGVCSFFPSISIHLKPWVVVQVLLGYRSW